MIKNERQYKISKAQAKAFLLAIDKMRDGAKPNEMPELLWKAQVSAAESQYADLASEIREYESLNQSRPALIEAKSLEDLPIALIKARIALGLSHHELAERMNLKEQQIQRYEATNYASATLGRLVELANALGVQISQNIFLPNFRLTKNALLDRTESIGISRDFFLERLLPADLASDFELDNDNNETVVNNAANILSRIFGWSSEEIYSARPLTVPQEALATARFKVPAGPQGKRLSAYVAYAHYLAMVVANACADLKRINLVTNSEEFREEILVRDPQLGLKAVLEYLWDCGIPVLPLNDAGTFHGACWRNAGRNVIVIKQKSQFVSRWVFDLLHEYHHATLFPENPEHSWIEDADITSTRRTSIEEQNANLFAGNVLLKGNAENLVQKCVVYANGNIPYLKNAVQKVAIEGDVGTDQLANYVAYRLSLQGVNWWGTASNLQSVQGNPFIIVRDVFIERFNFGRLNVVDAKILRRALTFIGGKNE
jgi:transcriptional regulator with XRE-family HTH domain